MAKKPHFAYGIEKINFPLAKKPRFAYGERKYGLRSYTAVDNIVVTTDYTRVPGIIGGRIKRRSHKFKVVCGLAQGVVVFHVSLQGTFGDRQADDAEGAAGRVDYEGVEVREKQAERVGRAVEGGPVAAGAVEAEPRGVYLFAGGDVEDLSVDQAHQADAGGFAGGSHT